ncbi:MAG: class D beta-lactamase [Rhodothermales bacterium]|nr:class D beta-lactamase [Rhodothermales bacterium]
MIRGRSIYLILLGSILLVSGCSEDDGALEVRPDFDAYFTTAEVEGVFVLLDGKENRYYTNDARRARQQFLPASTFKILNSLVALETEVVEDTSTVFEWDGVERTIPQWNRDHSLTTAYANSVVWVYQEIAREIGVQRMAEYVAGAAYGNEDISGGIDLFWLTGGLRISAVEQVDFLKRLHDGHLDFSDAVVDKVKGMMIEEATDTSTLYGKSGWADGDPTDLGWFVGFVLSDDNAHYFAINIDISDPEQGQHRRGIARSILTDLGLL